MKVISIETEQMFSFNTNFPFLRTRYGLCSGLAQAVTPTSGNLITLYLRGKDLIQGCSHSSIPLATLTKGSILLSLLLGDS